MGKNSNKKKVLIADDDTGILEAIRLILEDEDYEIETIGNGDDVLSACQHSMPDLLLLDIWMGGWNGKDVCRTLKNFYATSQMPIIIISANRDTAKIAREAGADDFIEKPFDIYDLLTKVQCYTSNSD